MYIFIYIPLKYNLIFEHTLSQDLNISHNLGVATVRNTLNIRFSFVIDENFPTKSMVTTRI